jgi:hypothetical protein
LVENELVSWATDNIVNLLIIAGVVAGGLKAVDHHYQQKIDDEITNLKERYEEDLKTLKESVKDKIQDLYWNMDRLENIIMSLILPGTDKKLSRNERPERHSRDTTDI